jgi:hypothetical protein
MKELLQTLPRQLEREALGHFMTVVHSETLESDRLDIELGAAFLGASNLTVSLPSERILRVRLLPAARSSVFRSISTVPVIGRMTSEVVENTIESSFGEAQVFGRDRNSSVRRLRFFPTVPPFRAWPCEDIARRLR